MVALVTGKSTLAPVTLNLARHGAGALRYPGRRVSDPTGRHDESAPRQTRKGHEHGIRRRHLLHGLLDGTGRARASPGGAGLRVAVGARALAHPALAPVGVPSGRRLAEEVLRRHGPVRDAG